jgi:hypothetical protein
MFIKQEEVGTHMRIISSSTACSALKRTLRSRLWLFTMPRYTPKKMTSLQACATWLYKLLASLYRHDAG